jgi:hypothetical protein
MENIDNQQTGGWARSPATLVQHVISSLPPKYPRFFNAIDGTIDQSVPVP